MAKPLMEADEINKATDQEVAELLRRWAPYQTSSQAKHAMLAASRRLEPVEAESTATAGDRATIGSVITR